MKLTQIMTINGKIKLLSGLHIGGGDVAMRIGGADSTVIKHPRTGQPYIPGSSLKGKIRSLLEWRTGEVKQTPLSWSDYDGSTDKNEDVLNIIKVFGFSADNDIDSETAEEVGPTRVSFSDCAINEEYKNTINDGVSNYLYEVKSENSINRITGTADNPRFIERVQAGTVFDFNVTMRLFEEDNEDALKALLLQGMKLLEKDNLGASGSRGYGKIKFEGLKINDTEYQDEFEKLDPFN